jgi:chemotaxis protein methyltransferase CheR
MLASLVRARAGLVLHGDAGYFAETRLGPLARGEGAPSVAALLERLKVNPDERLIRAVVEAMAIGETAFFRDRAVFDHIRDALLPKLAAARPESPVRVWCAGCSSGQEAYSLAILVEELKETLPGLKVEIVGTDLSQHALEKAQAGLYTQFEVQRGLPIRLLLKYFEKVDDMWRVSPALRQAIRWRQLNLIEDRRSVRHFDLVLCRNVLSDLDAKLRPRVVQQLAPSLALDGYLLLGLDESAASPAFDPAEPGLGLYRRNPAANLAAA